MGPLVENQGLLVHWGLAGAIVSQGHCCGQSAFSATAGSCSPLFTGLCTLILQTHARPHPDSGFSVQWGMGFQSNSLRVQRAASQG